MSDQVNDAMSDDRKRPTRLLGGYEPEAGLNTNPAGRPEKLPVPSLLRSLLTDHLDPGYAAAAAERRADPQPRRRVRHAMWQVLAALTIASVFAVAVAQAQSVAPATREAQQVLAGNVRSAQITADEFTTVRDTLGAQVDDERRALLEGDASGRRLLGSLDEANFAAAATAVQGPGLTVSVTDPGMASDLSDVSKQRVAGSRQVILDRDLQLVVNSLWASGAEAMSVGGVRIGPNVTIRQAGGGILVDNQPIVSPYTIIAVGPPHSMQEAFERSPGLHRLRLLEVSYGVGVTVSAEDDLQLPAGSVREVNFAQELGR